MELLLSAVVGELTTRSINYFVSRRSKPQELDVEDHLRRIVLRSQIIIDEAMGRHITNQALLEQLEGLKEAMFRSYYTLDTFRYQPHDKEYRKDHAKALHDLSSKILDVEELVMLLMSYPRLIRQPYSMYILLENCMFGRHTEAELAIKFLLHTKPHSSEELEVLPIVGPGRVGKSTLVAHVCKDTRVTDHFSEIFFLRYQDYIDQKLATLREGCAMKHQNCMSNSGEDGRLLVIVELEGDLDEGLWEIMYSASKRCLPSGSKIMITSRSDKIVKFGTTRALTLKYLSQEAYWYFFKTLAFGSIDPEDYPRHVYLAMEVARIMNGSLVAGHINAHLLRDNFDINFWHKVLAFFRVFIQKDLSESGELPFDRLNQSKPAHLGRISAPYEDLVVSHQYECFSEQEVPQIKILDVVYGNVKHQGKFEAIWSSQIPPYYSNIYTCEIREPKTTATKRKRPMKNGVTL